MKKFIIFLFTFMGLVTCSTGNFIKVKDEQVVNKDSLILQPSIQEPIIHRGHAAHASHASHYSGKL